MDGQGNDSHPTLKLRRAHCECGVYNKGSSKEGPFALSVIIFCYLFDGLDKNASMKQRLFLFLFFVKINCLLAQDTIVIHQASSPQITNDIETYFFSEKELPFETILKTSFKPKPDFNLNYITGIVWIKFVIKNESNASRFVLNASDGHVAGFYLFKPGPNGYTITPGKINHPEDGREIYNRIPAFFLDIAQGETKTFYLKLYAVNEIVNFHYFIQDYPTYVHYAQVDYLLMGLYFGALVLIITINIFYFISLKNSLFLVYAIYVFATFLLILTLNGFAWLWIPDTNQSYHTAFFILRFWPDIFLIFTMKLVSLKKYYPKFTKLCYVFIAYHSFVMPIIEFNNPYDIRTWLMGQWETNNWGIALLLVFITVIISYKYNKYLFKYYLIAYGSFLLIMIDSIYFLSKSNLLMVEHGLKVGTLIETIVFSFAVSRNFKLTEAALKKKKEDERQLHEKVRSLEMDVRKAQMNPHFMFNALASIEYFILKNDPAQASHYLSKFSKLMRLTLDNSKNNFVPLHDELEALTFYIELEFLRLGTDNHTFEIKVNEKIDTDQICVPPLIIQPFVENAIWHGLQEKDQPGKLFIDIDLNESELTCIIEDDGVGIRKHAVATTGNRKSSGISITKERLTLIHNILHTSSKFSITDGILENINATGTKVKFNMPYIIE